jgi:hypothetical protein
MITTLYCRGKDAYNRDTLFSSLFFCMEQNNVTVLLTCSTFFRKLESSRNRDLIRNVCERGSKK